MDQDDAKFKYKVNCGGLVAQENARVGRVTGQTRGKPLVESIQLKT